MSHTVDIAKGHKTRGIGAFLPTVFNLGVGTWIPTLTHRSNMVAWREEGELGYEILPDLDAHRPDD